MVTEFAVKEKILQEYIKKIDDLLKQKEKDKEQLIKLINKTEKMESKEEILLGFRRNLEMIFKMKLLLSVKSLSNDYLISVREENITQLMDTRFYSDFRLSSFLEVFKIETKDYSSIQRI